MARLLASLLAAAFGLASLHAEGEALQRIAFGSCAHQDKPQPIWQAIRAAEPDLWIWMGDIVYGDTEDMEVLAEKYGQLAKLPGYAALARSTPVIGVWDDHDYGANNAGKEYLKKAQSQQVLLDFLGVPESSPRRQREGVYHSRVFGPEGRRVQTILLDARYHRDSPGPEGDVLGEAQWRWLEERLEEPAALRLVVSGVQVLPEEHPYEKWANFPKARQRLLRLLAAAAGGDIVLLSGDRHIAEISRLDEEGAPLDAPLYEITSSSLTHSWTSFPGAPNRYRVGETYAKNNFGLIEIDWKRRSLVAQIRNAQNQTVRAVEIELAQPGETVSKRSF